MNVSGDFILDEFLDLVNEGRAEDPDFLHPVAIECLQGVADKWNVHQREQSLQCLFKNLLKVPKVKISLFTGELNDENGLK